MPALEPAQFKMWNAINDSIETMIQIFIHMTPSAKMYYVTPAFLQYSEPLKLRSWLYKYFLNSLMNYFDTSNRFEAVEEEPPIGSPIFNSFLSNGWTSSQLCEHMFSLLLALTSFERDTSRPNGSETLMLTLLKESFLVVPMRENFEFISNKNI